MSDDLTLAYPALVAGRYRLGPRIGAGGMAEVFRADDTRLGRAVAVKLLKTEHARDETFRRRFESEARTAAGLAHPNIVPVFDVGEDAGRPFIVMALIEGPSLSERLRSGPLSEAAAVAVVRDVLAALTAAHAAGVLHRDVKPANILLAPDGSARLADFGIAKAYDAAVTDPGLTATNLVLGTPLYLAPERAQGQAATVASDVWSAGVVLYECLAGSHPFAGNTPLAVALAAQRGVLTPLSTVRPDVTPALAAVAELAMATSPAERYPSAAAMAADMRAAEPTVVAGAPDTQPADLQGADPTVVMAAAAAPLWADEWAAPGARPGAGPPWLTAGRRRLLVGLGAVLLLLVLIVALWPGNHGGTPAASSVRRSTTTTSTSTTTTTAATVTTVSCPALRSQLQALTQPGPGGPGPGKHGHGPGAGGGRRGADPQPGDPAELRPRIAGGTGTGRPGARTGRR